MPAHVTLGASSSLPKQKESTPTKEMSTPKEPAVEKDQSPPQQVVENDFVEVYKKNKERIYNYVYLLVKNDAIAEDITADTFVKMYKKWSDLQVHKNIIAWLYLVAKNNVIDYYRSAHNKQTITFAELNLRQKDGEGQLIEEQLADNEYETMLADAERDEHMQQVQSVLHTLSLDDQTLLYMRYYEELPLANLAVIYNKTEDAMKMYLHRLVKKLQKMTAPADTENSDNNKPDEKE